MARLYLRIEAALPRHVKVRRLSERFGIEPPIGPDLVLAFLIKWWAYCGEFGSDGKPADCPRSVLQELSASLRAASALVQIPDIEEALKSEHLMDSHGRPWDWQDYSGLLLARRARDADRKRKGRGHSAPIPDATGQDRTGQIQEPLPAEPPRAESPAIAEVRDLIGTWYERDLDAVLKAHAHPESAAASIRAVGPGGVSEVKGATWEFVGRALQELLAAGGPFTPAGLRAFVQRLLPNGKGTPEAGGRRLTQSERNEKVLAEAMEEAEHGES
jgi:hypothetical protein